MPRGSHALDQPNDLSTQRRAENAVPESGFDEHRTFHHPAQVKFLISGRHRTAVTLTSTHTLPVVSRSAVPDVLCERRDHDEPERCQAGGESEIPGAHP